MTTSATQENFSSLQKIIHFIDPHLSLLIIEHFEKTKTFSEQQLLNEKIAVLSKTKIYDYFIEELEKVPKDANSKTHIERLLSEAKTNKETVVSHLNKFFALAEPFVKPILEDQAKYSEFEKEKFQRTATAPYFEETGALKRDVLLAALRFARLNFEAGQYTESQKVLNCLVGLLEEETFVIDALWGKLTSDLLVDNYAEAHETIKLIKPKLETKFQGQHMQILANRIFLLHTSLFAYLHGKSSESDYENLVDLFSSEQLFNAIPISAPHLIRYFISALLLLKNNPKTKNTLTLNTIAPFLSTIQSSYNESLVSFIKEVLLDFDFQKAKDSLRKVKKEIENDYFLGNKAEQIISNAQTLFFETYCKVYRKVDLKFVAEFLDAQLEDAEVWIVNLIRSVNMEAKIDLERGCLTLSADNRNAYEIVLNKTRDTIPRTSILINSIQRIMKGESI